MSYELDDPAMVLTTGFAPALATLSTSCLCWLDYASRKKWSLQPVTLRQEFFTKEIRRLLSGAARSSEFPLAA